MNRKTPFTYGVIAGLLLTCSASADGSESSYPILGKFRNTWYYLVDEQDHANESKTRSLRDPQGNVLAWVSAAYKKAIDIEGSGKLQDGRVLNYFSRVNGEIRYHATVHPYGRGVGNCALEPMGTIAVDPTTIPLGSTVFIDETLGMKFPDNDDPKTELVHNGLWKAEDVGGAIKKDRIDIFVGAGKSRGKLLEKNGIKHLQALTVRLVSSPPEGSCVKTTPR